MKIINLKAKNFWSYQLIDFNFDKGLCLVDGYNYDEQGSNGAGKSALFNAVCYGLFGDLPKKIKSDDIINRFSEKECIVILEIEDGGKKYLIERGRKPNVLRFYINGQIQSDIDAKQTQKIIEQEFGFTFDTFLNSVYFSQNTFNFLHLNDEQKKSILTDLLNLDVFDRAEKLVKIDLDKINQEFSVLKTKEQILENTKALQSKNLLDFQEKFRFYDEDKKNRLNLVLDEKNKIDCDLVKIKATIEQLKQDENALIVKCSEHKTLSEDKIKSIGQLEDYIQGVLLQKNTFETKLKIERSKLVQFENGLKHVSCPTCFQNVDKKLIDELKYQQLNIIEGDKKQLDAIEKVLSELPSKNTLEEKKRKIVDEENLIQRSLGVVKNNIALNSNNLKNLNDRLQYLDCSYNKVSLEENPYHDSLSLTKEEIQKAVDQLSNFYLQSTILSDKIQALIDLKEIFGNKGIKSYVFDNVVNELNVFVNDYLKILFTSDIRIDFNTQSETAKGSIKQSFSQKIFLDGNEVALGSFSGGEERRLIFAVNLALSKIVSNRSTKNFNIAFFDEAFDGLDYEGKRNAYTLLVNLFANENHKDCVLIIDHTTEFQTMFENVIKVEKRNGVSQIIE